MSLRLNLLQKVSSTVYRGSSQDKSQGEDCDANSTAVKQALASVPQTAMAAGPLSPFGLVAC